MVVMGCRLAARAGAGESNTAGVDWARTNGSFHRVALDSPLKLSHMASTGQSIRISRLAERCWCGILRM